MDFVTEISTDEPDDQAVEGAPLDDDIGPLIEASPATPRSAVKTSPAARWQSAGPFLVSLLIHGLIVIVLAKAGLLNAPASVSIQSGGASGDGIDLPGDGLPPMRAEPAAAIPAAAPIAAAPVPDALPLDPASELTAPVSSHKDSADLLAVDESPVIGLSLSADAVPQFSHTLPEAVRRSIVLASAGDPSALPGNGAATPPAAVGPHREGTSDSPGTGGGSQGAVGAMPSGSSRNRAPAYPREARRLRQEGRVLLLVEVMEDGTVGSIIVSRSSGYELLDQAAMEAVKRWQFTPAYVDGQAARSEGEVPVEFSLRG